MKRFILITATLMWILTKLNAQITSSHNGFYTDDSVFYQLSGTDSFKYCVNCYTADSLRPYTGGRWLYPREHAPNTWENSVFAKGKEKGNGDPVRADVVKVNSIWVRVFNATGYTDQHYTVFLGNWRPKTEMMLSISVDSADFLGSKGFYGPGDGMKLVSGYNWNYNLKIEKTCYYQIFGGRDWQREAEHTAGVELSATYSAEYPDKAMQLNVNKATDKQKYLPLGKSLTDSLGQNIKILRLRVGGANHMTNILANEIATAIIKPDMGGEPSIPICVFINGSFWTYAFAEEGMGPNHISKILKTPVNHIVSAKMPIVIPVKLIKDHGVPFSLIGNSVYSVSGLSNVDELYFVYNDTVQFEIDTSVAGYNPAALDTICDVIKNGSNSLLSATLNRAAFYRYALSILYCPG